jgi:hypothetical protein
VLFLASLAAYELGFSSGPDFEGKVGVLAREGAAVSASPRSSAPAAETGRTGGKVPGVVAPACPCAARCPSM